MLGPGTVRRLGLGIGIVLWAGGCGTDAVGVAECRSIEQARCSAAVSCGFPAVEECQRFFRDHCLHGVPLGAVETADADACVADIQRLGACATEQGGNTAPNACTDPVPTLSSPESVCAVVRRPELAEACAFLQPTQTAQPTPPLSVDAGGS